MTAIAQALGAGYSAQKILQYLSQHNPRLAQQISAALNAGHSIDHILNFIQKNQNRIGKLIPEREEISESSNLYKTAQTNIHPSLVGGAKFGAAAAGAYALSRAAPKILQSVLGQNIQPGPNAPIPTSPAAPVSPQVPNAATQTQIPGQQTAQSLNIGSSQPPVSPTTIQQTTPPIQPQVISNPKEYLEKHGILEKVDTMLKKGNPPETIAAALGFKKGAVKIDPELQANIEEYAKQKPIEEKVSTTVPKERENISKNETVASPQGIGEVKEIRNGKAIIEIDGKKHQVDEDELIQSPLPEKDLADLHDEYMRGIEEETGEDISRMVNWAGYNPNTNSLAFLPHIGALYTYKNISPEQAKLLTSILSTRKTSGENFIGAWKAGSKSPIGAAMSSLIKTLQEERGGKGQEYEEKFETIYDALEPGKLAAKKKKKKKKNE